MGLRINTNILSLASQRHLSHATSELGSVYSKLSSGLRIVTAGDDAAGLGVSERMRAQINALATAGRNTQDGISLAQTTEAALDEVNGVLVRMKELAIQSANGTFNSGDRVVLDAEFQALVEEIDRIAAATTFNGIELLNTGETVEIQIGIAAGDTIGVNLVDTTASTLSLTTLSITEVSVANTAITNLDDAIDTVVLARGGLGATQSRLESAYRSILSSRENLSAAESRIRDVDVAEESANLARLSIMQQAATSILAQANQQPQVALSLLQG